MEMLDRKIMSTVYIKSTIKIHSILKICIFNAEIIKQRCF